MVKIGKSSVETTPMGLGTNAVGGHNLFSNLDDQEGIRIVQKSIASGITLLDTAFVYGLGESEKLIGQAIKGMDRSKIQIASKGAQKLQPDGSLELDNSPEFLRQAVEDSLKRLNTDYLDIFYIHFPAGKTPLNEAVSALNDLKKAGKIRAIGVSNLSKDQLIEANRDGLVDVDEEQYSLIHREMEQDRFDYLKQEQISFVPYFPLASGLLTGKYQEEQSFPVGDVRHDDPNFKGQQFKEINQRVDVLRRLAAEHEVSVAEVVLAWYLKNPAISVVIPGAKKVSQVEDNAKSLNIKLNEQELLLIDQTFK
ncbi:aldo/keto reductase [Xylocopilactobacillus apicola]|uniref:Oxidoreductase n=1 Tax=Xylocopilactobacillus apicola TaxID=2932184 RepID=A0AAU9CW56_9LACO|nr:aldo/keto reductase [Xylocopilactobacillus apicola]BDR58199.1 oxidoreductase [Xylocopilactobacillus apicola]